MFTDFIFIVSQLQTVIKLYIFPKFIQEMFSRINIFFFIILALLQYENWKIIFATHDFF